MKTLRNIFPMAYTICRENENQNFREIPWGGKTNFASSATTCRFRGNRGYIMDLPSTSSSTIFCA